MTKYLIAYAATLVVMVAIDMIWLGVIARPLYQQGIGHLMAARFNAPAAVVFYLLFAAGLVLFAVAPTLGVSGWQRAAGLGALFGFFAYATYDLTNLATLRDWPVGLSVIDMAWGTLVSAVAAGAGQLAWSKSAGG